MICTPAPINNPALGRFVALAKDRLHASEVWLVGSRARGDNTLESDWDLIVVLPDDAPEAALDSLAVWQIGRDAGLIADVVAERKSDLAAAADVPNTLAYALSREGRRLA
jgi:predicted nucleotidyltransferase